MKREYGKMEIDGDLTAVKHLVVDAWRRSNGEFDFAWFPSREPAKPIETTVPVKVSYATACSNAEYDDLYQRRHVEDSAIASARGCYEGRCGAPTVRWTDHGGYKQLDVSMPVVERRKGDRRQSV